MAVLCFETPLWCPFMGGRGGTAIALSSSTSMHCNRMDHHATTSLHIAGGRKHCGDIGQRNKPHNMSTTLSIRYGYVIVRYIVLA